MAKRRKVLRSLGLTAKSETRRGFTMPTIQKIKTALRTRSKSFIINLFISAFSLLSKTQKIRMLIRIERRGSRKTRRKSTGRRKTRRKARSRKVTRRKRTRKQARRKAGGKKRRTAKQRAATRKLVAFNKRRRR